MPLTVNPAYVDAVLHGLSSAEVDPLVCVRAVHAARRLNGRDFARAVNWLVAKRPELGSDSVVWDLVCSSAEHGKGAEEAEKFDSGDSARPVDEIIRGNFDFEVHAINEERGSAFVALAAVARVSAVRAEEILCLLERRIASEPLLCVRMAMMQAIGECAEREAAAGLRLLRAIAGKDLRALQCRAGRQLLAWAALTREEEVGDVITALSEAPWLSVRAWGIYLSAITALHARPNDSPRTEVDRLRKRVTACAAKHSLVPGPIGAEASRWLVRAFSDEDETVRDEVGNLEWPRILDDAEDRSDLIRSFLGSPSFNAHHSGILEALADRAERYRDLARDALERILPLIATSEVKSRFVLDRIVGRLLMNVYRVGEGDSKHEGRLLDLFDQYLAMGLNSLRESLDAYESG
jgi:hypothetical protein